jgi:hypothetical protein
MQEVAVGHNANTNVELGGRNTFKFFPFGISNILQKKRHLHVYFGNVDYLSSATKVKIGRAYTLLYRVECGLRVPLAKTKVSDYQALINRLLTAIVEICSPSSKTQCNSIKFHFPYHWADIRVQLGCSANEKSLEKKLAETQKRNFTYTNKKGDMEVHYNVIECDVM